MSGGVVQGQEGTTPTPIDVVDDAGTKRLAVDAKVSGTAAVNLDSADDEVAIFGAEDGGAGTRRIVNVDSSGRVLVILQDSADRILGRTAPQKASTSAVTTVADNAANVTLLAANTNRLGATITNDSSARLHVKLGATASTTSYTASLAQHDYFEVPFGYTGIIDGIWASDPNDGAARVTELTA